jgi:uncharacterized membrane protein YeaQ/YmgE (transglycosylase-associated protein family)
MVFRIVAGVVARVVAGVVAGVVIRVVVGVVTGVVAEVVTGRDEVYHHSSARLVTGGVRAHLNARGPLLPSR